MRTHIVFVNVKCVHNVVYIKHNALASTNEESILATEEKLQIDVQQYNEVPTSNNKNLVERVVDHALTNKEAKYLVRLYGHNAADSTRELAKFVLLQFNGRY